MKWKQKGWNWNSSFGARTYKPSNFKINEPHSIHCCSLLTIICFKNHNIQLVLLLVVTTVCELSCHMVNKPIQLNDMICYVYFYAKKFHSSFDFCLLWTLQFSFNKNRCQKKAEELLFLFHTWATEWLADNL